MRNLLRFLEVPFDDIGISLDELIAFSSDHLQRMIANNPGALFNARITATTTALAVVETCTTSDQTKLGLRMARTQAKDTFRRTLPEKVAMFHGAVVSKFGPNAPELAECFPQGRTIFTTCRDDRVENHLQTLIHGLTAHQALLGEPVVDDANGLLSTWVAVFGASESSMAAKTTTEEAKRSARLALQLELFKNLLTLAMNFARQPEKLPLYMQQSLLANRSPQKEDDESEDKPSDKPVVPEAKAGEPAPGVEKPKEPTPAAAA